MEELAPYAQAWAQAFRHYRRLTGMMLFLSRRPQAARLALWGLNKTPRLFQKLLKLNMGE